MLGQTQNAADALARAALAATHNGEDWERDREALDAMAARWRLRQQAGAVLAWFERRLTLRPKASRRAFA